MSRSKACAGESSSTPTWPRSSLELATTYSQVIGLRFCGIVDEPTCASVEGSATSAISVDWSRTISARDPLGRAGDLGERVAEVAQPVAGRVPVDVRAGKAEPAR